MCKTGNLKGVGMEVECCEGKVCTDMERDVDI